MVKTFNSADFRAAMQEKQTLVVDFYANWCGPCRMLAPVMEEVSGELGDKAKFAKIDIDANPDVALEYGIMSIPCVMVFKGGEPAGRKIGFTPKDALQKFIEQNL